MARDRRSTPLRVLIVAVFGVASLLLVPTEGAGADPFGYEPGAPGYFSDSTDHWYCFYNVPGGYDQTRVNEAMEYLDQATVMYDVYTSYCGTSTDIIWAYQTPISEVPGARGIALCVLRTGYLNLFCDQFLVKVDIWQIGLEATNSTNHNFNIHKTVRHELGHTPGLSHHTGGNADAMISGPVDDSNWSFLTYTSHQVCHVNQFFGSSC